MRMRPLALALASLVACTGDDGTAADGSTDSADTTATDPTTAGMTADGTVTIGMTDDDATDDVSDATDTDADTSTTGNDTTSSDTGNTTDPIDCRDDNDCGGATPLCIGDVCVACDVSVNPDAACASLDPATPACVDGVCVECTAAIAEQCVGLTPVCDAATNVCVGCTQHDQCDSGACKIPSFFAGAADAATDGACFDVGDVVTVDTTVTLMNAIGGVAPGGSRVILLESTSYSANFDIDGGRDIALLAADGATPTLTETAGPTLTIAEDARLWIHGLRVFNNGDAGTEAIVVDSGRLHAQRSEIVENSGGGIAVNAGAFADIENCFVSGNATAAPALTASSASVDIRYSTLGRTANFAGLPVLVCTAGTVNVSDSLIIDETGTPGNELNCPATLVGTAVESTTDPTVWFEDFLAGNYHLTPAGATQFEDIAEWNTGDPPTDIDGTDRTDVDGTPDVAGADLP